MGCSFFVSGDFLSQKLSASAHSHIFNDTQENNPLVAPSERTTGRGATLVFLGAVARIQVQG